MYSAVRFSDDSDGSVIVRWVERFGNFETALRFVVTVLDRETADIADSCSAALESDDETTVDDVNDLYGASEWIAIHDGERDMNTSKNAPFRIRANVVVADDGTVEVVWFPVRLS